MLEVNGCSCLITSPMPAKEVAPLPEEKGHDQCSDVNPSTSRQVCLTALTVHHLAALFAAEQHCLQPAWCHGSGACGLRFPSSIESV